MWTSLIVLVVAAVLCAGASLWVLRAYRRAGGGVEDARPALAAAVLVSLAGLAIYLVIGRPELPDAPYQQRLDTLIAALRSPTPPQITPDEQLALWQHFAREHPEDVIPHMEAAKALLSLGRPREAAIEFDQVLRLQPESSEALLGMGRAIVALEGRVTPEAQAYFAQAAERTDDPAPWLYQAMAAMQENRQDDARRFWREALARMGPEDPRRAMAERFARGQAPQE